MALSKNMLFKMIFNQSTLITIKAINQPLNHDKRIKNRKSDLKFLSCLRYSISIDRIWIKCRHTDGYIFCIFFWCAIAYPFTSMGDDRLAR